MVPKGLKNFFLYSVGHTYSNLSRLFLRLFTGILFLQFGLRQIIYLGRTAPGFDGILGLSPETSVAVIVTIELIVAVFIMLGLLTRIAVLPGLALMCYIETLLFVPGSAASGLFAFQPGYPVMFIGIFIYMLLAGPGKISVDYLIAVHFDRNRDEDEVLENA